MKIGIDVDSTLNNLVPAWVQRYNETYGDTLDHATVNDWSIYKFMPKCEPDACYALLDGIFLDLEPLNGSKHVVRQLKKRHDVYIVTTCLKPEHAHDKAAWVAQHYRIEPDHFIATSKKGALGLDILIDDGPHNFIDHKGIGILFDQPWNWNADIKYRACGWSGVKAILQRLEVI
jgi:5'(3')-deoxyribonucleotidase